MQSTNRSAVFSIVNFPLKAAMTAMIAKTKFTGLL